MGNDSYCVRMIFSSPLQALAPLVTGLILASQGTLLAGTEPCAWKLEANKDGVEVYSRPHGDSGLKEFKSVGLIDAAPHTVFELLSNSADFPKFMPYSVEVKILQKSGSTVVAYHRLDLPLIDDRDYILRSVHTVTPSTEGPVYHIRWQPAEGIGPSPRPGVHRVTVCQGSWLLEPTVTGETRATYDIYSDTGGAIPAFLANGGSRTAIRKVFTAIRKRVLDPKYSSVKSASAL